MLERGQTHPGTGDGTFRPRVKVIQCTLHMLIFHYTARLAVQDRPPDETREMRGMLCGASPRQGRPVRYGGMSVLLTLLRRRTRRSVTTLTTAPTLILRRIQMRVLLELVALDVGSC